MTHLTKSAKASVCSGLLARLATSSSEIEVDEGGCDHLIVDGEGCCVVSHRVEFPIASLADRDGRMRAFMAAFVSWSCLLGKLRACGG